MKLDDIKPEDIKKNIIYGFIDKDNTKITEIKVKNILPENSGYYLIPGKIKTADGSMYPAILGVSSDDSGELFDVYCFINNSWTSQNDKNFLKKINKSKSEVFPYKYHLNVKVEGDINEDNQF